MRVFRAHQSASYWIVKEQKIVVEPVKRNVRMRLINFIYSSHNILYIVHKKLFSSANDIYSYSYTGIRQS